MPAIVRLGDINDGGGAITSTPNSSVFADGLLIAVDGSKGTGHGPGAHAGEVWQTANGSSTVFVEGIGVNRVGDTDTCGHKRANGSPTIIVDEIGHEDISLLPVEFSVPNTQEIRQVAGRFAPLDDPENISKTPVQYSTDSSPAETTPVTENINTTPQQTEVLS